MEKKFYEAPELEVLDMEMETVLLAGSPQGGDFFPEQDGEYTPDED